MLTNSGLSSNEKQPQIICPFCHQVVVGHLGEHIKKVHGDKYFKQAVLEAKKSGISDEEIGKRFGISYRQLEQIITENYGANVSTLNPSKKVRAWAPKNFKEETTTVWSFKSRGNWATHNGRYRGNWSPYIPRNLILKYTEPGEVVLDYFVGGGTTAIEAKLLGRRCIARDINPAAIALTKESLKFTLPNNLFNHIYEPEVSVGDARDLGDIATGTIDLICAHPPYAGIISYSSEVEGDLSKLSVDDFLKEMKKVAWESLRVLKPGGKCAILIGDARKKKHVIPIGFQTIRVFLNAGFTLRELVIKRQHNCKTTGFWYKRSIQYNFLLLAHEYLPIFEKPKVNCIAERRTFWEYKLPYRRIIKKAELIEQGKLETTTVWIFPRKQLDSEIKRNLLNRFGRKECEFIEIEFNKDRPKLQAEIKESPSLIYVSPPNNLDDINAAFGYRKTIQEIAEQASEFLLPNDFFVVDTKDVRINGVLQPMALLLWDDLSRNNKFSIKEVVIVVPENLSEENSFESSSEYLHIVHRYLLIFRKREV